MGTSELEILLVEDNPDDAELAIRSLRKHNLANKLLHLENGEEALEYIFAEGKYKGRGMQKMPQIILLDIHMPKVNGIEVLKRIKADVRTKKIPVIILTSSKEDPDVQECYNLGVNSYVVKPVDFDAFTKAVGQLGLYWVMLNCPPN